MDIRFVVQGGIPLRGDVTVAGSKNAALPLIAATVLTKGVSVLQNVPRLQDILIMLEILEFLGIKSTFEGNTVRIDTTGLTNKPIPANLVCKLRGSIVLLGPLLARFGVVEMSYPGGCVLGKRPIDAHVRAFAQLGAVDMSGDEQIHLQGTLKAGTVILPEFSVTATENAIMAAALLPGETTIELAAAEPHVQDVCAMVQAMGADIRGIGTHTLVIRGKAELQPVTHAVIPDYLEAGAFVIAALVTKGKVRIHEFPFGHLVSFMDTLSRLGAVWKWNPEERVMLVDGEISSLKAGEIRTNIFPGFPTDLQSPMGVLLTQAKGVSRIFERLFEGRMAYLYELEKMGAHVEVLNSHQALIIGPTPLKGRTVASNDIRAGAGMVLAALCAEGQTTITDVRYIERGYDRLDEKLRNLGAKIQRVTLSNGN